MAQDQSTAPAEREQRPKARPQEDEGLAEAYQRAAGRRQPALAPADEAREAPLADVAPKRGF